MFTKPFSQLSKTDADIAGGKGASLGEMLQSNIPVPDGYVVLSTTFDEFLHKSDLAQEIDAILESVDHKTISSVESASEKIQELIKHASMPEDIKAEIESQFSLLNSEFVAVRSSATAEDGADHAWAGQLESYLNTTQDTLLEKVQHCWASLFTPRAIFYRFEKGLDTTKISVAVVVQKMVNSEKSGIAFSVHPVTEDRNQIIIEAGFGLGEAIVSGSVTPDSYVISKQPREIIDINVSNQTRAMYRKTGGGNEWLDIPEQGNTQVFNDTEILALSEIIMTIENHYGFPCDIEWAYEGDKFYIVQSRPITTLSINKKDATSDATTLNPEDYIRMFRQSSFSYLFSNVFINFYKELEVVSVQNENAWISFFPKKNLKKTHVDGKSIFGNHDVYSKYRKDFDEYFKRSEKQFNEIISKNEHLSADEVQNFFNLASELFKHYSKTEFFYTDGINEKDLAISVQEFDKLKLDGRAYLNKTFFETNGYIKSLLKKISNECQIDQAVLLNYGVNDLISLIQFKKQLSENDIPSRDVYIETRDQILFGESAKNLVDSFVSKYLEISHIIHGTVANKGTVSGYARVLIPDPKNFDKISEDVAEMKEGEILIAETTSPDIILACKKAAAIITNQGGQLSHAAIVSRELNIPCVIGTNKDVLLNIKTGDFLSVDAINGIITVNK